MGATPQSGWEKIPPLPADFKPKISYEEFKALVRELHQAMMEHDPNYDLDAELEAEHQAILNGADL